MLTNTLKLRARIIECGYTLSSFAAALGLSRQGLRNKMYNISDFRASEIALICKLLQIDSVEPYFFCNLNSQNG